MKVSQSVSQSEWSSDDDSVHSDSDQLQHTINSAITNRGLAAIFHRAGSLSLTEAWQQFSTELEVYH